MGAGVTVSVLRGKFGDEGLSGGLGMRGGSSHHVRHVGGNPVTMNKGKQLASLPVQTSPLHLPGEVDGHHDGRYGVNQN